MALGIDVGGDSDEWQRMKGWVSDPFWVMRCIGYPPLPSDAEGVSCGAHKGASLCSRNDTGAAFL